MMSARAFMEAIIQEPEEDSHRLIFADWLEEQDDPRSEFIRLQCELDRLEAGDPERAACSKREQELRQRHASEWASPIARLTSGFEFRRGFVERIRVDGADLLANAAALFRLAPVRALVLTAGPDEVSRLAHVPQLARLTSLDLRYRGPDAEALAEFLESPHLAGLTSLKIRSNGTSAAAALQSARHLRQLTRLELSGSPRSRVEGYASFFERRSLPPLTELHLNDAGVDDEVVGRLAKAPLLSSLGTLEMRNNNIGPAGLEALCDSPRTERLTTLSLGYNRIGDRGLDAVGASTRMPALERLFLSHNGLLGAGVKLFANARLRAGLTHLDLDYNQLSSESLTELASSPHLKRLQSLFLRCGPALSESLRRKLIRRFGAQVCKF
jgi:uncharacterized protein (TIGR02996 family)